MPKTKQYAYKVVRSDDNGETFRSAIKRPTRRTLSVQYKVGRITRPVSKTYPFLFVFETKEQAKYFANGTVRLPYCKVFKAEVTNPTTERRGRSTTGTRFYADNFPRGTKFVDTVKLLHKVA